MRKSLGRSLLILAVYGGVVLLMLLLAVFARGFSQEVGDAQIAGRYAVFPLLRSHTLKELTLTWNGIALRFSRSTTPALEGIETNDAGTDIVFAGNTRLRLTPGSESGGSLSIAPVGSSGGSARAALVIPYTVAGAPGDPVDGAALSWKRGGRTYNLSLPAGARADAASRSLTLPLGGAAGIISLRMAGASAVPARAMPTRAKPTRAVSAPARLPDEKSLATSEQLQAALARFADAAYAGWSQTRLSAATGQWKMPDATLVFSEDIGIGLLAESIARGTWQQLFPIWSDALRQQQRRAPDSSPAPATSTYMGNVRDYIRALGLRAAAGVDQARGLLQKSDPAVLAIPGLIPLLLDHGGGDLTSNALAFLTGRSAAGLDTAASLGLLEGLVDYAENVEPNEAVARSAREAIARAIIPLICSTDAGLFLASGDAGKADVGTSLRCGSLLLRAGAFLNYSLASAVGRGLLTSGLGLAGEQGFLPARITLASGRISAREGTLAPESVYALLPLDRRVPKEISLSRQWSPGSWILTSARLVSASGSFAESRLLLAYPVGVPHHLAIQGVAPFAQIRLHGIAWRTDPAYVKYSDGWAYDGDSRTLFLKLTGRTEQEEIDIRY